MKYHVIVSGEGHDCQLFVGFEGKPEGDATAADVIAALKATPEARAEVLDALGEPPASRHLDVAAAIARAEQAERDRDQWRAKWEALETTRAACCGQMERERDEARAERDSVLDRLAGAREARDAASDDAEALRAKLARFESVTAAARLLLGKLDSPGNFPRYGREHEGIRNALRALDEDSGGSGASPAVVADAEPTPEPAGSSCGLMHVRCAICGITIDRENKHDCTRGKNACGECDQESCACPEPGPESTFPLDADEVTDLQRGAQEALAEFATRREVEELRREVLTTLADALCEVHVPMPGHEGLATVPAGLRELAEGLRARIERGPRRVG